MQTMYPAIVNSPETALSSAIDAVQTTISVLDASKLPAAPNLAIIGTGKEVETILYTGKTANDLTGCTRGFQGVAASWVLDTLVARFFTAYDHDTFKQNIEGLNTNYAKYVPQPIYNVKGFGAKGDGVTDDTAAIQAAINAAADEGTIFFPSGNYICSSTIAIKDGINIVGASMLKTIITSTISATNSLFRIDGKKNINISNVRLYQVGRISYVIEIGQISSSIASTNVSIRDCHITGFDTAIRLGNVYFVSLDNLRIDYCNKGIDIFQAVPNSVNLNQVSFYECTTYSFSLLYGATAWNFNACTFEGKTLCFIGEAFAVTLNSCYFEYIKPVGGTNVYEMLWIGNDALAYPRTVSINGCTIVGDINIGIAIYGCDGLTINGLSTRTTEYGIVFRCENATSNIKKNLNLKGLRHIDKTTGLPDSSKLMVIVSDAIPDQYKSTIADTIYAMQLMKRTKCANNDNANGILNDSDLEIGDIITWNYWDYKVFKRKRNDGTVVKGTVQETFAGTTAQRPWDAGLGFFPPAGYMYFDTTLGKPIWWNGSAWIDAATTEV